VSDALQNLVVIHLREQYVDAARQASEWETKLGAGHIAVTTIKARMKDIETQIQSELQRIAGGYQSDYRAAVASQTDIETQLTDLVSKADGTNNDLVRLRALQSSAETYKSLYQNFLQRYTQAVQDQSFPISEAQIVTVANPPLRKSYPKGIIVLGASGMLGLAIGFGVAFLRESLDTSVRTPAQIRAVLGLKSLGLLPTIKTRRIRARATRRPVPDGTRIMTNVSAILSQSIAVPNGAFAETLRGLRVRMTQNHHGRSNAHVIACVSSFAGEGKTTVSANLAFFLSQIGFRTLLLDGDCHKQSLSRLLVPDHRLGFSAILSGSCTLEDALWHHPGTQLDFLPASVDASQVDLCGDGARAQLKELSLAYEYVVIDMPAVSAVTDALSAEELVDGYLLVIEWGRTPLEAVKETLADLDTRKILGAVLNKVDFSTLPNYSGDYYAPAAARPDTRRILA
jgi:polysaccharide biosynthesis transport protein